MAIVKTYDYTDESGKLPFQVVRCQQNDFRQRRPNAKGRWIWNIDGRLLDATKNGSEKSTPQLTPKLTATAFSGCNRSGTIDAEDKSTPQTAPTHNCSSENDLETEKGVVLT